MFVFCKLFKYLSNNPQIFWSFLYINILCESEKRWSSRPNITSLPWSSHSHPVTLWLQNIVICSSFSGACSVTDRCNVKILFDIIQRNIFHFRANIFLGCSSSPLGEITGDVSKGQSADPVFWNRTHPQDQRQPAFAYHCMFGLVCSLAFEEKQKNIVGFRQWRFDELCCLEYPTLDRREISDLKTPLIQFFLIFHHHHHCLE